MNAELIVTLILKVIDILREVDFSHEADPVISKELRAAKTLEEVHAAIAKLRRKVTP